MQSTITVYDLTHKNIAADGGVIVFTFWYVAVVNTSTLLHRLLHRQAFKVFDIFIFMHTREALCAFFQHETTKHRQQDEDNNRMKTKHVL